MQRAAILFEEENYLMALPIYENLYNQHPKEEYLKYCYAKCGLLRSDKHEIALTLLTELYAKNKKIADIELDLAKALHYNYKFDEALTYLEKFNQNKKNTIPKKNQAKQLVQYCLNAKLFFNNPTNAKIENSGNVINTENEEYVPVISADEAVMIYTYRGKESTGGLQNSYNQPDPYGIYYEDIFLTIKIDNEWQKPVPLKNINTNTHDAAIAISADGYTLFVYKDSGDDHGDIYESKYEFGDWTTPQKLRGQVNSYSWEGSCSMTSDGKYLYFSSERGGGFGGKDIYRATLLSDGSWGNVINLGDSINTALDDDAPFIHPDGVTLFYSSKGKNSMGGYDIFQAKLNPKDSSFFSPVNMGYPINTPDDDIYYVLSANGERGYYASGKSGGQGLKDIYTVYPGYIGQKPSVYLVKGKITLDSLPVQAEISILVKNKENTNYKTFTSEYSSGKYLTTLSVGEEYTITYKYKDLKPVVIDVDTRTTSGYQEKIFNVNFTMQVDTAIIPLIEPKKDSLVKQIVEPPIVKTKNKADDLIIKTDKFIPRNPVQQKIMEYSAKYGDISAEGLLFRVQIAAYKYPKNYEYKHLKGLGNIENLLLDDGITRITIGGEFNTLSEAFEHNKKVVIAGQSDAFVTALYKGKRVYLEDLEKMGIFK